ncbi:MAG TPA: tetratricopeptide repeat protein [bacterium]|nr:tetratricopeptide repeat protein [bacterium]
MIPILPSGTVTFLFTDIEGSTRLWEAHADAMRRAVIAQESILREAITARRGHIFKTVGDGVYAAFADPLDAVEAARRAQEQLQRAAWEVPDGLRVRMAIHTGAAESSNGDYLGPTLNRVARLLAAGHGGQILLSDATRALVEGGLPEGVTLRDHGRHRLRDLAQPERIFQLVAPGLAETFPPLRSLEAFPNNLPRQLTSFIGRERELAEVTALLRTAPLVTLTGPGGAGKTRLALQVGAEVVERFPDGVWLVALEALSDPALVPAAIAAVVGVREETHRPLLQTLVDVHRPKELLLIVDNCEHLLQGAAQVIGAMLHACPRLRVLATSQERLGIPGEVTYPIAMLPVPDPRAAALEAVAATAAVRLFVDRAVLSQVRFVLTAENAPAVAQIVRQLDGIPLAIELAAARVQALSVEQIAARLDDRLRLLTTGPRTEVPRHQTLRAVLDWSYDLLAAEERALLRRLAVFAGGFVLEAAEAICGRGDVDVLNALARLVARSLVVFDDTGPTPRYRLLETVRLYGLERLRAEDDEAAVRTRHRDWYLVLAEQAEPHLTGAEQKRWLDRLEEEHDNLRAALTWCRDGPDGVAHGLRLAGALTTFWDIRGHWREGREWLETMLARSAEQSPARVKALNGAANFAFFQGDFARAASLGQESLDLSRRLGDRRGAATCLNILGFEACRIENYGKARALGAESLQLSRESGDQVGTAAALAVLGLVARGEGDTAQAEALLSESVRQLRALGDKVRGALVLQNLGLVLRDRQEYERAGAIFEETLAVFEALGDRWGVAFSESNLGILAWEQGQYERGAELFRRSLVLRHELGDRRGVGISLVGLAAIALRQGALRRAAILFAAAAAVRDELKVPPPPFIRDRYEALIAELKTALAGGAFEAAWQEGQAMKLPEVVAFALREGTAP